MACFLTRGFPNLTTTTSNVLLSRSPSVLTLRNMSTSKGNNNTTNMGGVKLSSRALISRTPSVGCAILGVSLLNTDNDIRKKEAPKIYGSNERFDFSSSGSSTYLKPGGLHEGKGWEGGLSRRRNFVVTTDGPLDLSVETDFGQVSGDLEQEPGSSSEDSFPRGTDQSARAAATATALASDALSSLTHTISEAERGLMGQLEDALGFPLGRDPQSPFPNPLVIVISGPSGVGKDAVIRGLQLLRRDLHFVVTATTRAMRPGEVDGVDYYFTSKTEFEEMIENHELLEHAIVYGDYKGIPKQQVREAMLQGRDVVLRVDVQGAATIRSLLGSEAVFIFLAAESEVTLVKRLIERKTETVDKMLIRVATAREELTRMVEFDYVVVNQQGRLDKAIALICSIIDAEKSRVKPKVADF